MTHALEPVHARVAALATGRRRNRRLAVFVRTLFYGLCGVALVTPFLPPATALVVVGALLASAALLAVVAAAMVPVDAVAIAKRFDDRAGTHDLLSSSLELTAADDPFVRAVHEDACATATGAQLGAREVFPTELPRETRWLPLPAAACAAAMLFALFTSATPFPRGPSAAEMQARLQGSEMLRDLRERIEKDSLSEIDSERLNRLKELEDVLKKEQFDRKDTLAELARLASQLDKERQELEGKRLEAEKNATRLAKGEDLKDAQRDMEGGKFREAATKIEKKIKEVERKLEEAKKNKADKLEIEKLEQKLKELKQLLAELMELDALGKDLGFLVDVLEALDRIEGALGELGEFDGEEFDNVQLGRPQQGRQGEPGEARQLFAYPSNEAGTGHAKKVLDKARRALTERQEEEAKLREGKGKSSFGQVKTANDRSRSQLAYRDAAIAAKQAAEDSIYRQNIPAGYRTYIRTYFETMQPDERAPTNEGAASEGESTDGKPAAGTTGK